jgi:hypothetical protein
VTELFGVALAQEMLFKVSTAERKLTCKVGDNIALTAQDLYEICLFMQLQTIPKIMEAFIKFLNGQGVEMVQAADGDGLAS